MRTNKSRLFRLKVWGEDACFTRPEMKVERVSYDVMTPSAARGILEAILWKPAIRWQVERIDVLKPIRWESVRRNEVACVMSTRTRQQFIEDQRQQRAGLLLRDVAYTIHAFFRLTELAAPEENIVKFQEMFLRRAEQGQSFHCPYLGCREFAAHFQLIPWGAPTPTPICESKELGYMLHEISYAEKSPTPHFFRAYLNQGSLRIPALGVPS